MSDVHSKSVHLICPGEPKEKYVVVVTNRLVAFQRTKEALMLMLVIVNVWLSIYNAMSMTSNTVIYVSLGPQRRTGMNIVDYI